MTESNARKHSSQRDSSQIDAYKEGQPHTKQTSGDRGIEDFPNQQRTCDLCGMVARNDDELQSHMQSGHGE